MMISRYSLLFYEINWWFNPTCNFIADLIYKFRWFDKTQMQIYKMELERIKR